VRQLRDDAGVAGQAAVTERRDRIPYEENDRGACLGLSCDDPSPGPSATDWPGVLNALATGTAIFAPQLIGPPEAGRRLHVSVHQRSAEAACALYGQSRPTGHFWYLDVTTTATAPGVYKIATDLPSDAVGPLALVRAREVVEGKKGSDYSAVSGEVTISGTPRQSGGTVSGQVRAVFEKVSLTTVECGGGMAVDGSAETTCTCQDSAGGKSACTPTSPGENCCLRGRGGATVTLEMLFKASFCEGFCSFTDPALARYCSGDF
jgi:hypothetical protein